jgi:hypothetical protein
MEREASDGALNRRLQCCTDFRYEFAGHGHRVHSIDAERGLLLISRALLGCAGGWRGRGSRFGAAEEYSVR